MNEPTVSWYAYNKDGVLQPMALWDLGNVDVDADSELTKKVFRVWNNIGGTTELFPMNNCKVQTRDLSGGYNSPAVKGKWIKGKCASSGITTWSDIGSTTDGGGAEISLDMPIQAIGAVPTGQIKGLVNAGVSATGLSANSVDNVCYAEFDLKMAFSDPTAVPAGAIQFNLRLQYDVGAL